MSPRRTPIIEVFVAVALILVGIFAYVLYSKHSEHVDTAEAIHIARTHVERDKTVEQLIDRDNPGAPITWSVVIVGDAGLVRVAATATRTNGVSEYRFDVDPDTGRVHAANPLAIELIEPPPATE